MNKKRFRPAILLSLCLFLLLGIAAQGVIRVSAQEVSLWIVTEETVSDGMNGIVLSKIEQFQQEHPGVSIRLDILPNREDERAEYLQSLREQISSGTGPDLFLLPTGRTVTLDQPTKFTYRSITPLFSDVTAAMADGMFADISTLYDQDDALGKDALNQAVMDAGTLGGARYVLPLRYNIPMIYCFDEMLAEAGISEGVMEESIDSIMRQAVQSQNLALARCADMTTADVFSNLTTQGGGALTAQEVAGYLRDYQALKALLGTESAHLGRFDFLSYLADEEELLPAYRGVIGDALSFLAAAADSGQTLSMYPLRSTAGDTMAFITYYGAVSSSCQSPELAYEFLRQFLLEDVQWEQGRNTADSEWPFSPLENGWPVRTRGSVQAIFENIKTSLPDITRQSLDAFGIDDSSMPILEAGIDLVRFPVQTDFGRILSRLNQPDGTPTDADVDALAEEFISTLQSGD